MNAPITITATVAAWVSTGYSQKELMRHIERGDAVRAVSTLVTWGGTDEKEFGGDYIRVGEADVTVRLIPKDEQVRAMVQTLQAQLEKNRAEWLERQQAILAEISKLSALEHNGSVYESA